MNAKKKDRSSNEAELPADAVPPIKGLSTIGVAELLEFVKNDFSDVLSDDVLLKLGVSRNKRSLSESIKYSNDNNAETNYKDRWTTERAEVDKGGRKIKKGSTVNIADIVNTIREKFDILVATDKVTDREASGIYKERAEAIRTRIANNLPTISHELGHHLDKLYKLSEKDSITALRNSVSQEFLEQYPSEERNGEAIAEFIRTYLKNKEEAKALCPEFYDDFVNALSKDDLKSVNEIANSVNEYMSYNFSERVQSSIASGNVKEKTSLSEKAKKMHANWIDGFISIKDVVDYVEETTGESLAGGRNAYTLATNSLNARAIANFNTVHGYWYAPNSKNIVAYSAQNKIMRKIRKTAVK